MIKCCIRGCDFPFVLQIKDKYHSGKKTSRIQSIALNTRRAVHREEEVAATKLQTLYREANVQAWKLDMSS